MDGSFHRGDSPLTASVAIVSVEEVAADMPEEVERRRVQELRAKGAVVVEVLGAEYFADAHLPGARNMPLDLVDELACHIVPDLSTPVVVYCSDRASTNSTMAADRLEQLGYRKVFVYRGGKQDWIEHGLEVDRGFDGSESRSPSALDG